MSVPRAIDAKKFADARILEVRSFMIAEFDVEELSCCPKLYKSKRRF